MLGEQIHGLIHVAGFQHTESTQLLFGLGKRTISHDHLAILPAQSLDRLCALQCLSAIDPVPALEKLVVVGKALLDQSILLALRFASPRLLLTVCKAGELHRSLPYCPSSSKMRCTSIGER